MHGSREMKWSFPGFFQMPFTGILSNLLIPYMKKACYLLAAICLLSIPLFAQVRVVADCTLSFAVSADDSGADKNITESLKATTKTVYIRGNDSRTDLVSPSFTQTLIYNKSEGSAVILREFGSNKFMTRLDAKAWAAENKRYEGMTVAYLNTEVKTILGYECKKAVITLKDGSLFTLFYATAIVPSVRDFEFQFKDIPGFVLEYESQDAQGKKIRYTATKVQISPVQASKFDIPLSGYRLLN